jgi:hypothetical protein
MFIVAGAAGPASFTHVHNVARNHGQPGWLAWADAVVIELMSIAAGLELRRRKRAGTSVRFPATVLACAVALSLAAQVVEAEASLIGWIAAAIPALGFLVMVKIALSHALAEPATDPVRRPPGPAAPRASGPGSTRDTSTPVAAHPDRAGPRYPGADGKGSGPDRTTTPPQRSPKRSRTADDDAVRALLPAAQAVRDRLATDARPLTRGALARELRADGHTVSNSRASSLLKLVKADQPSRPVDTARLGADVDRFSQDPPGHGQTTDEPAARTRSAATTVRHRADVGDADTG